MSQLYILSGPERGKSYTLREGANFLGRSLDNDIRIEDRTVSRKHLRIVKRKNKYLVTDLKSRNGTFLDGNYIRPGIEVEVEEGNPIAIGITVFCIGEGCQAQMMPLFDSNEIANETEELNRTVRLDRDRVTQRKLNFLYKVSNVLTEDLSIKEALEKILVHIFDLLKRIDRAVFILIDPGTEEIREVIFRSNKPGDNARTAYCEDVVNQVIKSRKPFMVADAKIDEGRFTDTMELLKIESVMCVPLISRSEILGVIYIDSLERPYGFRKEDLALLVNSSQRIAPAIDDARFASDIWEVAEELLSDD